MSPSDHTSPQDQEAVGGMEASQLLRHQEAAGVGRMVLASLLATLPFVTTGCG